MRNQEKTNYDTLHADHSDAELEENISTWNGDIKAATAVRNQEKTNYDTTHADYSESVDALERAIAVLKKSTADPKKASLFFCS